MENPDLDAPLTHSEFESLRSIARGPTLRPIPDDSVSRLKKLGYIDNKRGGLSVTDLGALRIKKGA